MRIRSSSVSYPSFNENISSKDRLTASLNDLDENAPSLQASRVSRHTEVLPAEEKKSASPMLNRDQRMDASQFPFADNFANDGLPFYADSEVDPAFELSELNKTFLAFETGTQELVNPTPAFVISRPSETGNTLCPPPSLMDTEVRQTGNVCVQPLETTRQGEVVDIFFDASTFTGDALEEALSTMTAGVRKFTVELPSCKLTKNDITLISYELGYQGSDLREFNCVMHSCKDVSEGVTLGPIIDSLIHKVEGLHTLSFDLRSSKFVDGDEKLLGICDVFKKHPNLTHLTMGMQENNLSKKFISKTFYEIANLKYLEFASFNFSQSRNMDEQTFSNVFGHLREMTALRGLSLAIQHNHDLNEEVIAQLGLSLPELKNMEQFRLYVRGGTFDAGDIQKVLDATQTWVNLRELHIDACYCEQVDPERARHLMTVFAEKRNVVATIYVTPQDARADVNRVTEQIATDQKKRGHESALVKSLTQLAKQRGHESGFANLLKP